MPTDNNNHRRTRSHILFMAIQIVVFAVAPVISISLTSCQQEDDMSVSERTVLADFVKSIEHAEDESDYQEALQLCKEFYEKSQKGYSNLLRIYALVYYGEAQVVMGNAVEGKKLLDEAMNLSYDLEDDKVMMELYNGYGLYEGVSGGNNYAAAEYYLKALGYTNKGGKEETMSLLCNLALAMSELGDTTGLKYALEATRIAEESGNARHRAATAIRMSEQMLLRERYQEAKKWIMEYVRLVPAMRVASANMMLARIHLQEKDYVKAQHYIDIAVAAADTTTSQQPVDIEDIYYEKAKILHALGKYDESNKWLDKTMDYSRKTGDMSADTKVTKLYADNYEHLGNHQKALEYQKKYLEAVEENASVDRINILKAKEVALDVAKKDAEIVQQKDHARMLKWILWGTFGFIALLMALCLYIYNMYRRQRKLMTVVVERAQPETVTIEQKQMDDKHAELFRRMKEEIDDNKMFLDANLSRESLAKHLGTNRTYISEAVAQMTGMNFPQYINLLRIKEAERRLHDPQVDVSNFANFGRTLGFASLNAFRTAFKQQTGMTLSAYREIARAKAG